jgi:hypothetical protein
MSHSRSTWHGYCINNGQPKEKDYETDLTNSSLQPELSIG